MKKRMAKLLAGIMFVNVVSVYPNSIGAREQEQLSRIENTTLPGVIEMKQTTGGIVNLRPQLTTPAVYQLSTESWTPCEDGKWRKKITPEQMIFENFEVGDYKPIAENGIQKDKADYKPVTAPINEFYDSGSGASGEGVFTIVGLDADDNESDGGNNKALKFVPSVSAPNNIMYKARIDSKYRYEVTFRYKSTNANVTLQAQKNGQAIPGAWVDDEGNPVIKKDGSVSQNPSYNYADYDALWQVAAPTWHHGKVVFDGKDAGSILDLKLWKGANAEIIIDYIDIVAVSYGNPENLTSKEKLIRENDLVQPKNAGSFEAPEQGIGETKPEGGGIYKKGTVEISNEDSKNAEGYSAKINSGSELVLEVEQLEPHTEYSIFFTARPTSGKVEFRMSGFKDNQKFDYDNGNYSGGNWKDNPTGKDNMFNWIENLKINDNSKWNDFRYDFTTGANELNSVRARFTASGGDAFVDDLYIVKRETLNELTKQNELPANDELSRGHRILIDEGLQYQSWITTDVWEAEKGWIKQPDLDDILDMGLTAVQYNDKPNFSEELHQEAKERGIDLKWSTAWGPKYSHISSNRQDGDDGRTGQPTEEEWLTGYLTPEMGLEYVDNLVSMCIGDEEDYSDTLTQNVKSWFELIRERYETEDKQILLHHNEVGNSPADNMYQISTFNKDMLRKYVRTAKPDMITYDMYYFRERRIDQTQGGSVIPFYDDLNRYRIVSSEGLDGTGEQPIPFGQYHYAWRTGPGAATQLKRGDGWYEMTESQINLYSFATWTFGGKWMSNFRWLDENPTYLFNDYRMNPDGTYSKYHIYDQFKEMVRQSKNLGPHLVRIQNQDVAIVRGEQLDGAGNVQMNRKPADNPDWSDVKGQKLNQDVFIQNIAVENLGEQNNGLNGDVFVSYFKTLPGLTEADQEVFTSTDPRYFMILNGLTAGDGLPSEMQQGSSYETRQEITVTFELPDENYADKLRKVSRVDGGDSLQEQGKIVTVPLQSLGGNRYQMTITIGGGYADLFYWELGDNKATTTQWADESGKESEMSGNSKYANPIEKRDLEGRTITIGHIKGTDDMAPEARMGSNINKPADADLVDGKVIDLNKYTTAVGNITAIGTRYYSQDIWQFRIDRIQEDNNVKLEFKEYDWTKEELLEHIELMQNGEIVAGMPDLLVVPNEWIWEKNNLIANQAIVAMSDFEVFDFAERKWNGAYKDMASKDGKTYGATIDPSMNPTGMFVNKTLLGKVETSAVSGDGIYKLQKEDKWSFEELEAIIDAAIKNNIAANGYKLFADNEHLMRQLLVSAGVDTNPYAFDANSEAFKEAMRIYNKVRDNDLLLEGGLEQHMQAFQQKELIFLVAPYTDVAKHLTQAYWVYEDNAVRYEVDNFLNKWGRQSIMAPPSGENWKVTVKNQAEGKYVMATNDWNFMLFPKATDEDEYRAIINGASYPVMLSTTKKQEDVAFIWNELAQEYKGVDTASDFLKRGTEDYPVDRVFEPAIKANFNDQTARDVDTLRKVGLRDGYGDLLKASGVWDDVLGTMIYTQGNDGDAINEAVKVYLGVSVNKEALKTLIKQAERYIKGQYSKESWAVFAQILEEAYQVVVAEEVTQEEINQVSVRLQQAMAQLQPKNEQGNNGNNGLRPEKQ